jgi:putative tricarboxylic transport membrane protein
MSDRISAVILLLLAAWFGFEAWQFKASFFSDPLGARAIPLAVAVFMIPLAIYLFMRAQPAAKWPSRPAWPSLVIAFTTFVAYALLIQPLGFILATTLFFVVFGRLYHARIWQGAVAGVVFSAVLYVVFVQGLELYLPVGRLFERVF